MDKNYIIILRSNGSRVTTLATGIHSPTLEGCKNLAKEYIEKYDIKDVTIIEDDGTLQEQFMQGKIYDFKTETMVEPPKVEQQIVEQDNISNINIDNTALLEILANQEERLQALEDK